MSYNYKTQHNWNFVLGCVYIGILRHQEDHPLLVCSPDSLNQRTSY